MEPTSSKYFTIAPEKATDNILRVMMHLPNYILSGEDVIHAHYPFFFTHYGTVTIDGNGATILYDGTGHMFSGFAHSKLIVNNVNFTDVSPGRLNLISCPLWPSNHHPAVKEALN